MKRGPKTQREGTEMRQNYWTGRILTAFLLGGLAGCGYGPGSGGAADTPDRFFTLKRADLTVGMLQSGMINSRKKHKLSYEGGFRTKIVFVVDEGAQVQRGELLVEFDAEELTAKVEDLQVELENGKKTLQIAEEELEIQKSSNDADLRKARDAVVSAEEAFYKYIRLEGPKARDAQTLSVESAREKVEEARKQYEEARSQHAGTVYDSQEAQVQAEKQIENLRQTVAARQIAHDNAGVDQKIFKRYTYPNRVTDLENALEQARLDLRRAEVRARSQLVQKESQVMRHRNDLRRTEREFKRHSEWLPMMKIHSPVDGVVVYGDPDQRRNNPEVKVGLEVFRGGVLMTIPDLSELVVDMDLPEMFRSRVSRGNEVLVMPDSVPGLTLPGRIEEIAALPVNQIFWDTSSPKIFKTVVELQQQDERLINGMNVQCKIVTQRLKDVLSLPIEAVFEEERGFYVYRRTRGAPEKVPVEIGAADDSRVEIAAGLEEGDVIYLYQPFSKAVR